MNFASSKVGAAGPLLLVALLAGCHEMRPGGDDEGARRDRAIAAANDFVAALNRGACQSIYDDASSVFREMEPAGQWMHECAQMRDQLGRWEGTSVRQITSGGAGVTVLRGSMQFEHGTYGLQMDCMEERGRARLFLLELDGGTHGFVEPTPRIPALDQRRIDTPGRFAPNPA